VIVRRLKRAQASQQDGELSEDDEQPRQKHGRSSALPPRVKPQEVGDSDSEEESPVATHRRDRRSRVPGSQRHVPAEGDGEQDEDDEDAEDGSGEED
jgi:hypothetical protein